MQMRPRLKLRYGKGKVPRSPNSGNRHRRCSVPASSASGVDLLSNTYPLPMHTSLAVNVMPVESPGSGTLVASTLMTDVERTTLLLTELSLVVAATSAVLTALTLFFVWSAELRFRHRFVSVSWWMHPVQSGTDA